MTERTLEPTPERLRKAQKEGKSQRSQLFSGALLFLLVVYGISPALRNNWVRIQLLVECLWSQEFTNAGECGRVAIAGCSQFLIIFLIGILFISVSVSWFQVGSIWMPAALLPDLKRVFSAEAFSRVTSSLAELPRLCVKGLCAVLALGICAALVIKGLLGYQQVFLEQQQMLLYSDLHWYVQVSAALFLVFGVIDLLEKRRRYRQQVYMNYEEMKREYREHEGDPHLKSHRRALHQALSREEMIRQIRRSKVIVVERASARGGQ